MNVFRAFFALSWTVGPAVAGWVLYELGFKGLFLCVSGGYLLAAIALAFLLKDIKIEVEAKPAPVILRKFIVQSHILKNIIAMTCMAMASSMANLNMSQFITKVLNGTEKQVGLVVSVPPVFEVPFMIAVGILATKIGSRLLIRLGFGISVFYYGLLFLVTEPWQIYPIQILSAAQVSITAGIAVSYFQDFIPDEPGTATALYMNTTQVGNVLGFLGFGFFSSLIGYHNLYLLCTGLVIIGLTILLSERGTKNLKEIIPLAPK
jgi:MFS transporter, SET family, sugar efflux transporter